MTQLVPALQNHGPPLASAIGAGLRVIVGNPIVIRRWVNGRHAVGIISDVVGGSVELRIAAKSDRLVPTQHELLIVGRHHQGHEVDRGRQTGIHLFIQPVFQTVEISTSIPHRRIHLGPNLLIESSRTTPSALRHESPNVSLNLIIGLRLPSGIPKHWCIQRIVIRVKGRRTIGFVEVAKNLFVGIVSTGNRHINIAASQRIQHRLVGRRKLRGTDVPIHAGNLPQWQHSHLEIGIGIADPNVSGVLYRTQVAEHHADRGTVVVTTDQCGGVAAGGADGTIFSTKIGHVELTIGFVIGVGFRNHNRCAWPCDIGQTRQPNGKKSVLGHFLDTVFRWQN